MSWYSKVAWKEGLFLQPHHLQQNDRYVEKLIEARTRHVSPYPWGIEEMRMNRDRLLQGRVELATVSGIFPDGTPFEAPDVSPLPRAIEVPEGSDGMSFRTAISGDPTSRNTALFARVRPALNDVSTDAGVACVTESTRRVPSPVDEIVTMFPAIAEAVRGTPHAPPS